MPASTDLVAAVESPPSLDRPPSRAWAFVLGAGLLATAAFPLTPTGAVGDTLYLLLGLVAVLGLVVGTVRYRPAEARPWRLMATGLALWVAGDTVYSLHDPPVRLDASFLAVGDVFYLVAYPLLAAAMVTMARGRLPHGDRAATLDALLVASGLGILSYEVLVRPTLTEGGSLLEKVVQFGYPLGDVLLLAGLVRVLVSPGAWTPAGRLLLGAVLTLVGADVVNAAVEIYVGTAPRALQVLWLVSYVLWGSAALHPSMVGMAGPSAVTDQRFGPVRLLAVGAAVLVAPVMLAVQQTLGLRIAVWTVVIGSIVMFTLVVTRMYLSIRQMTRSERVRAALQAELQHEASHDFLTGLPNRAEGLRLVAKALQRARRSGDSIALLFVDLDGFKLVNDLRGHAAGDELLVQVGRRLGEAVRAGDVVARLGGDEFIVLLEPVEDAHAAMLAARRVVAGVAEPFALGSGGPVHVGASVGVALNSALGTDAEALLHHADLAAYRAKSSGKGRADLFDADLRAAAEEQGALESAIRSGIEGQELRTYYQPILDLERREVIGYEALVRWERPGRGLVPPADFVAVAEQSDLICELDTWVLTRACMHFAAWSPDLMADGVHVTVNISARHLARSRVVNDVSTALVTSGLAPQRLVVEVTETSMADELRSLEHLRELRALGVGVAIDDFGTGYSSMARLQEMPADTVKIDRCFLDESRPGWIEVLRLMVGAAHAVGMRTVAEGVENAEQLEILTRLGCDAAQGYHLSRPMPAGAVPAFHLMALQG